MKKNYLLLFTDFFPFDRWEPYLIPEMKFLPKYFDRIFIFSNHYGNGKPVYKIPPNTEAFFLRRTVSFTEKISALRFVFSKNFWEEISWIKNHYHESVTSSKIKIALIDLWKATYHKRRIEKFLRERNLEGENIFVYSYWTDYRALSAAMLKRDHSYTAISRAHGWDVYFERHPVPYLPYRKLLTRYLSSIFFVSENGKNYFLERIRDDSANKLHIARLAIEGHTPNPVGDDTVFTLVSCARLVPLKRVHLIADILKHVNDLPLRWIHFGKGMSEKKFLEHVNHQIGDKKNIQFEFRGDVDHADLLDFYSKQHVDLFILTSEYEGMPFVIIEALSFGIPVMATNVGGIQEVITNENGLLLEKDFDTINAAKFITQFANLSHEKKSAYRQKAFETWDRMFNGEKNFPEFIENLFTLQRNKDSKSQEQ